MNTLRRVCLHDPLFAGLLATCMSLGCSSNSSPTGPTGPPAPGSTIVYAALGASDVTGVGSSVLCPLNDCPNGTGYVQVAVRQLRALGFTVSVNNLGLPTAVIGRDFETLGQQYGHFVAGNLIEQEMPFVRANTTLVTVFAGANEINTMTAALGAGAGGADPIGYIDAQVKAFGVDFTTLLSGIRSRAGSARIIALNVPNLAGLPFLSGSSLAQRQAAQRAATTMTTDVVNPLTSQSVMVIDLMCDPRTYQSANLSSDGLHPNDAGYAFIASELVQAVQSSTYGAPRSSCPQMTAVPNP